MWLVSVLFELNTRFELITTLIQIAVTWRIIINFTIACRCAIWASTTTTTAVTINIRALMILNEDFLLAVLIVLDRVGKERRRTGHVRWCWRRIHCVRLAIRLLHWLFLLNHHHTVVANASGCCQIIVRKRTKLIGALITKNLATISAMVLPEAVGELVVAALTVGDVVVGHPRSQSIVCLFDLVPTTAAYRVVTKWIIRDMAVFNLAFVLIISC